MSKKASIAEINELLQDINPFEKGLVVKDQNIWGTSFPDILELNKHVSDAIYASIEKLQEAPSSLEKVSSMVIRAQRGAGKTHVISRVRKQIQIEGNAVLIYAGADKYSELELIACSFRESVADSLDRKGSQELTQWQEVAAQIVTTALKANKKNAKVPSPEILAKKFDQACAQYYKKGKDLVTELAKVVRRLHPNSDLYIIRAIIWTLSEERGALAVKWLAGEELNAEDALDLRLSANDDQEDNTREAKALNFISKVISLIGEYKTVIICFDELDAVRENSLGFPLVQVVLDLIKRLFDSIVQSDQSQGILIATFLLPRDWHFLSQDGPDTSKMVLSRISTQSERLDLNPLNSETIVQLVSSWMQAFYERKKIDFENLIYPFTADELSAYGKQGYTAREALDWCAKQLPLKLKEKVKPLKSATPKEKFEAAYKKAVTREIEEEDLDNNELIASVLRFSFEKIISLSKQGRLRSELIENVKLEAVDDVAPRAKNNGYINFKVCGLEDNEPVVIGVEVLQQTHGLSVGAGFRRLLKYDTFEMTRGCLVRSLERKIKRNWDSHEYYQQLIQKGGEWVHLKEEELKPLIALKHVYDNHEKYDISVKMLDRFAFSRDTLVDNPLVKEILSRPEGRVVEEALEGKEVQHLHSEQEIEAIAEHLNETIENMDEEDTDNEADFAELEVA